jgi:cobalt-zinc-cadmium efflux system outer membrane protein
MAWPIKLGGLLILLIALSGCSTVRLDAGFDDVKASVEERSQAQIVWNNGSDLDRQAEEKVHSLLAENLTADQAVQVALLNNRGLQAIYSDLGIAQSDLVQAGLLKNPIFDAVVTFPTTGGRADLELTAVMNFLDVFYLPLRTRVAAARFEEAKLRVTGAVLAFAGGTRKAFYMQQANQQMLELRHTVVQALSASLEVARRLHDAGNISDLDFVRQRALLESGKLALRSAETAVSQSREQLNMWMGLWGEETEWRIDKRLPDVPLSPAEAEGSEKEAIEKSLDLQSARQRILAAGEELGFAKAAALIPEGDIGTRGERREGPFSVGPVLEFPIPLFDQGQGRSGRAAAELRRAQQDYYAIAVKIRSMARSLRDRIQAAQDRALYYRDVLLPLQEQILTETQLHYNAMQIGVGDLLRAKEQQIETAGAYVEALRDYWIARVDFDQLMSGRLPDSAGLPAISTSVQPRSNTVQGD